MGSLVISNVLIYKHLFHKHSWEEDSKGEKAIISLGLQIKLGKVNDITSSCPNILQNTNQTQVF